MGPVITVAPTCFGLVLSKTNFVNASNPDLNSGLSLSSCMQNKVLKYTNNIPKRKDSKVSIKQEEVNRICENQKVLTEIRSSLCRSFSLFKGRTRVKHSLSGKRARIESRIYEHSYKISSTKKKKFRRFKIPPVTPTNI